MMYENLVALSSKEHGRMRLTEAETMDYAAGETQTLIMVDELANAAECFPIVFNSATNPVPKAVLGLEKGRSSFVDDNGSWTASFIPSSLKNYPFNLVKHQTDKENNSSEFVITFASNSGLVQEEKGKLLYNKNGKTGLRPSPTLKAVMDNLRRYQQRLEQTQAFFQPLIEHNLLKTQQVSVSRGEGQEPLKIAGLVGVDWDALKKLDDSILADWVRTGLMQQLVVQRNSLRKLGQLIPR
ncbi:MAG: hypothetical protein CMI01_11700 [Oceanospirillaceae bacterium]|nr:hypothetical protein [Oceanospirillaceae bacterium]